MSFFLPSSEKGSILLVIVAISSILTLIMLGTAGIRARSIQNRNHQKIKLTAEAIRQSVMEHVYNNDSWQTTAGADTCLLLGTGCAPGAGGALILKSSDGSNFVDSTDPFDGFSFSSTRCNPHVDGGFSSSVGNNACPFQYRLNWSAQNCGPTKCDIRVAGTLTYKPASENLQLNLNMQRLNIDLVREREIESLRSGCTSVGGIFDQVTLQCFPATARSTVCPDGTVVRTLVEGRPPVCEAVIITAWPCPIGTAARGITSTGSLECEPP